MDNRKPTLVGKLYTCYLLMHKGDISRVWINVMEPCNRVQMCRPAEEIASRAKCVLGEQLQTPKSRLHR